MKLFFTILCFCFFNILNACTITFFDKVKSYDTMLCHMRFQKEIQEENTLNKEKISHLFFLEKDYSCIGEAFACWRHCNKTKNHRLYDAYVAKQESLGENEYHICVYGSRGLHEFDIVLVKDCMGINCALRIFKRKQHHCIFAEPTLANDECCCIFSGNDLIKLLQK